MKDIKEPINLKEGAILYFDKPLTWSSFDLVNKFRYQASRHLGVKKLKVGHAGTLDPLATGVMILCTGKCTKRIDELQTGTKEYIAVIRLGATTPTFDLESEPDAIYPYEHITREQVIQVLTEKFIGCIEQVPPEYSACKVNGHRAYDLARAGKEVKLKSRELVIDDIELLDFALPEITIRVVCSKGTYIRALARDIGEALGSGGHLASLRRTRVGDALIDNCIKVEDIELFLANYVPLDDISITSQTDK